MENYIPTIFVWVFTIYWLWSDYKKSLYLKELVPKEKYGCSKCKSEYESYINICADCNSKLADYI